MAVSELAIRHNLGDVVLQQSPSVRGGMRAHVPPRRYEHVYALLGAKELLREHMTNCCTRCE
eukprot:12891776-Prorocentrum_lima.AAC.1